MCAIKRHCNDMSMLMAALVKYADLDNTKDLLEICPRGNNKVVIYISLYHDKCLLFMLELY